MQHNNAADVWSLLEKVDCALLEREGFRQTVGPSECLLLFHIHLLSSSIPFFCRLIKLGFCPSNIVVVPKLYSTIPSAHQQLKALGCVVIDCDWGPFRPGSYDQFAEKTLGRAVSAALDARSQQIRRCILVDCGGMLTDAWCRRAGDIQALDVVAVQQTASGFYPHRTDIVHRINVATCAAKKIFEAKIIIDGVFRKVQSMNVVTKSCPIAIIGLGSLGANLATKFVGYADGPILTYDRDPGKFVPSTIRKKSWQECVDLADVIFGCTGRNFMHSDVGHILRSSGKKKLISISSRDVEFKSLLTSDASEIPYWPFDNVRNASHVIYNGGFPVNFDRQQEWERETDIALTRALVLLGVAQALCVPKLKIHAVIERLAIRSQRKLVESWLRLNQNHCSDYEISEDRFNDLRWWLATSDVVLRTQPAERKRAIHELRG
jgi:hypothetical protein